MYKKDGKIVNLKLEPGTKLVCRKCFISINNIVVNTGDQLIYVGINIFDHGHKLKYIDTNISLYVTYIDLRDMFETVIDRRLRIIKEYV